MDLVNTHFSIANNPDFEYTCVDGAFRDWKAAGVTKIDNMYLGDAVFSATTGRVQSLPNTLLPLLTNSLTLFHITKVAESLIFLIVL